MTIEINDPIGFKKKYYYSTKHDRFTDFRGNLLSVVRAAMKYFHNGKRTISKNSKHIESWNDILDRYLWEYLFLKRDNVLHISAFSPNELHGELEKGEDMTINDKYSKLKLK